MDSPKVYPSGARLRDQPRCRGCRPRRGGSRQPPADRSVAASGSARMRATRSGELPAGKGTMSFTARAGQGCAEDGRREGAAGAGRRVRARAAFDLDPLYRPRRAVIRASAMIPGRCATTKERHALYPYVREVAAERCGARALRHGAPRDARASRPAHAARQGQAHAQPARQVPRPLSPPAARDPRPHRIQARARAGWPTCAPARRPSCSANCSGGSRRSSRRWMPRRSSRPNARPGRAPPRPRPPCGTRKGPAAKGRRARPCVVRGFDQPARQERDREAPAAEDAHG